MEFLAEGFSARNLKYMRLFASSYPDIQFVQEVLAQLTWYHNIKLLEKVKDPEIRNFYSHKAIEFGWSCSLAKTPKMQSPLHY